jgi:hypothetical protein
VNDDPTVDESVLVVALAAPGAVAAPGLAFSPLRHAMAPNAQARRSTRAKCGRRTQQTVLGQHRLFAGTLSIAGRSITVVRTLASGRTSPADPDELEPRVPGAEPAPDFRRQDEAEFDTGAKDKSDAIRDERQDPEAQQLLGTLSFEAGYQRLWQRPDRSQILVIVYEFRSERDADTWAQTKERTERAMSPASEDFDLEVPDSSGVFSVTDNWRNWSVMFRVNR